MLVKNEKIANQKFRFSACVCWAAHVNVQGRQRHLASDKHNFFISSAKLIVTSVMI